MKRLSNNAKRHVGEQITIRWGTSRGRETAGYTTCSLRNGAGKRVAACNGGGYDMKGTVVGHWIAATFADDLRKLRAEDMPEHTHWQSSHRRICQNCLMAAIADDKEYQNLPPEATTCPECGADTREDNHDGQTISYGRYFYGLTFHDPDFNPGKAKIGAEGKTVEQAEKDGESLGLERYQAFYRASSRVADKQHRIPRIDGACGFDSVLRILNAIGLSLRKTSSTSRLETWEVTRYTKS
jgi:hypothetical protein